MRTARQIGGGWRSITWRLGHADAAAIRLLNANGAAGAACTRVAFAGVNEHNAIPAIADLRAVRAAEKSVGVNVAVFIMILRILDFDITRKTIWVIVVAIIATAAHRHMVITITIFAAFRSAWRVRYTVRRYGTAKYRRGNHAHQRWHYSVHNVPGHCSIGRRRNHCRARRER